MDVKSADKRPEKYIGPDGKPRIRMVPVDKQVIKKESAVDEVSLSAIKKAVTSSGLKNVKKAQPTDKLKKDLEAMKLRLAKEGTISEATDMNKLKQLAAAGLVQKADVQKLLRVFAKMESGKTVTPAEREMLLSVLSDLTSLITGDMSMLQKAKKAVKEEAELDEGLGHISAIQNMMAKEREAQAKKKKYTAPTQAEIDADKKKERRASGTKKASMTFKDVRKRQYANMMGGLKNESVELEEDISKMSHSRLKWHMNTGVPHGSYSKAEMKAERDRRMKTGEGEAYKKAKPSMSEEVNQLDEVLDTPKAMNSYRDKAKASKERAASSATATMFRSKDKETRAHPAKDLKTIAKRTAGERMADRVAARQFRKSIGRPYINKEEVELDELKKSTLASYVNKASDDRAQNALEIGKSGKINFKGLKRRQGIQRATKRLAKEEFELDEAKRKGAPKMQGDWLKKEREKNRAHDAAMGRTPTGRKKPERAMTSTQRSLAKMRAEEVEYVNEKLKVSDGMGAWVSDFQKSDAPQFKGKSDKERRDMAVAAYLSAKRGAKDEGYVSMAQQRAVWATRKDGGKGHPDNKGKK